MDIGIKYKACYQYLQYLFYLLTMLLSVVVMFCCVMQDANRVQDGNCFAL